MPFPAADSDIVTLNVWNTGDTALAERRGTTAAGTRRKARYSFEIKSEPLLLQLDELNLGQKPAEAIRDLIKDQIAGIAVTASKATQALRVRGALALAAGASWAVKRYSGGRLGTMQPNQSNKLFNDSGRLHAGVHVRMNQQDASFTVNWPANRFNPETFGAGYDAMMRKFVALVPALDPKKLLGHPDVEKAIKAGLAEMMQKAEDNHAATIARKLGQLKAARMRVVKQLLQLASTAL
jgi:hypothetical protein